jgi:hypothetical protein
MRERLLLSIWNGGVVCDFVDKMSNFCTIDYRLLDIYTGIAKWVMMKEQVYRLMNNKYEDECKGVYTHNYLDILAIVIVLVHLCYGCCYFFCGYNGGKK